LKVRREYADIVAFDPRKSPKGATYEQRTQNAVGSAMCYVQRPKCPCCAAAENTGGHPPAESSRDPARAGHRPARRLRAAMASNRRRRLRAARHVSFPRRTGAGAEDGVGLVRTEESASTVTTCGRCAVIVRSSP